MSERFRELLGNSLTIGGGAHDALSARLVEAAGFPLLYVTGYGVCATALGLPDMGFLDRRTFLESAERIRRVTTSPMLIDADTGYGEPAQIEWLFSELARVGVDAAHVEDLEDPLRYRSEVGVGGDGQSEAAALCDQRTMATRIRAATAGGGGKVSVVARCDAARFGVERTIARLRAYVDAGADACMVAEAYSLEDLARIAAAVPAPLLCCVGARADLAEHAYGREELKAAGVSAALFTAPALFAGVRAMREVAATILERGRLSQDEMAARLAPFGDVNDLLDTARWYAASA
jgi:2-methylisocitrate lyase-like PEP mutase family enzyme